jgi:small-conductance mechanosensitive channel
MNYRKLILLIASQLFFFYISCGFAGPKSRPSTPDTLNRTVMDSSSSLIHSPFSWFADQDIVTISYAVVFFFLAFILIIFLRQPLLSFADSHPRYSKMIKQIVSIFLITCSVLIIYISVQDILEISEISSMILLAIIGLALIASFQDILKDVIAGLVLPFQKHLEVGCKIGGTNYWGEITRIGLRDIEIKKPDGHKALLPISVIMKEPLMEIYCEKENCPITLDFYFNIHTDIEKCQQIAYKAAIVSPYLYLKKPVTIIFKTVWKNGQAFIKMEVQAYLQKIDFQQLFINDLSKNLIGLMQDYSLVTD